MPHHTRRNSTATSVGTGITLLPAPDATGSGVLQEGNYEGEKGLRASGDGGLGQAVVTGFASKGGRGGGVIDVDLST